MIMTREQITKSVSAENFIALSSNQKQEVWNSAIDQLSKINVEELSGFDAHSVNGGEAASWPPPGLPTFITNPPFYLFF